MSESRSKEPDSRILAELSALADGSLAPGRADEVRARIAQSAQLTERYERERQAVLALRELRAEQAPASLRFAIEERRHRAPSRPPRRARFGGMLAAATAVAVALVVLLLPAGSPGAPSVSQAAALALRGSTGKAPGVNPRHQSLLGLDVQETYFPNWGDWFGWVAVGQRADRLDGQMAVTVYYKSKRDGREIAYTILASPPLRWHPGAPALDLDGIKLQSFTMDGRLVVTWRRAGHTCILSGVRTNTAELAKLASWKSDGLTG